MHECEKESSKICGKKRKEEDPGVAETEKGRVAKRSERGGAGMTDQNDVEGMACRGWGKGNRGRGGGGGRTAGAKGGREA